ncbi:glycosyltransferase [Paraclostridium sordellii]|uniref:Glycosyl transferases group 1 n=1 Tax=Paraclostridium sordellii TaxID=1505 RepID=A0A9P1L1L7_PARSO|nr:glycosyltransferase [Paeniclostridium sordellii]CEO33563.1 Glycosyl transferases group 1 [[Clostridium] sordellii] [Paeniclostridium sordellii]
MNSYIFLRNKEYRPSSYYRTSQYILDKKVKILEYEPNTFYKLKKTNTVIDKINNIFFQLVPGYTRRIIGICNILLKNRNRNYKVYIQRTVFPKVIGPIGKILLKRMLSSESSEIYWDFDDNIIESGEVSKYEADLLEYNSKTIIVGNDYLKSTLNQECQHKVKLMPTTDKSMQDIDVDKLNLDRIQNYKNKVELVWVGTNSNLVFLKTIVPCLDTVAKQIHSECGKILQLNIISNASIQYDCKFLKINNVKWERDLALKYMNEGHIGLMPLKEDFYTLGKCGFKAVQNIGVGLPTIVSDVGFNKQVISHGHNGFLAKNTEGWIYYIKKLSLDENLWHEMSINARKTWEEKFNSKISEKQIHELLDIKEE